MSGKKDSASKAGTNNHSVNFVKSFTPVRYLLQAFGRLPFFIKTNDNGISSFHFQRFSFGTFHFCCAGIITFVPFILIVLGFFTFLTGANVDASQLDWCSVAWENTMMARHIVPIVHSMTWLCLTFLSSLYMFMEGQSHAHYFNYWNRAVRVLDIDVTKGLFRFGVLVNIQILCGAVIFTAAFASYKMPVLYDSAGMVSHFFAQYWARNNTAIYSETLGRGKNFCGEINSYYVWTWVGFVIQFYSMFGARSFLVEYQFFCKALENAAKIWNERFTNVLNAMESRTPIKSIELKDPDNPGKKRLQLNLLLKDHLILVKLFKMTESTFQWILVMFYFAQMVNLVVSVYFISQIGTLKSCIEQYDDVYLANCTKGLTVTNPIGPRFFQCNEESENHIYEAIVAIILFVTTFFHFYNVTMSSSNAFEEAMRGFRILRTHVFTSCNSRKERNFIHSLATSFAKNNPIGVNAGGYFQITREFVLLVYAGVTTCFIILIQLRPSVVTIGCSDTTNANSTAAA